MRATRFAPRIIALALIALLTGCNDIKEVRKDLDQALKEIQRLNTILDENWKATIRAVPGERYLQLIDSLHGPDGPEKDAARAFLKSLGNLNENDLASQWSLSVYASWEGDVDSIEMDIWQAPSPVGEYARHFIVDKAAFKPANAISRQLKYRTATRQEIEAAIEARAGLLYDALVGVPRWEKQEYFVWQPQFPNPTPGKEPMPIDSLLLNLGRTWTYKMGRPNGINKPGTEESLSAKPPIYPALYTRRETSRGFHTVQTDPLPWPRRRDVMAEKYREARATFGQLLKEAIIAPLDQVPVNETSQHFSEPWEILGKAQTLFVFIRKEDWDRTDNGVEVTVTLHKKGDPKALHPRMNRAFTFPKSYFTSSDSPPIRDPKDGSRHYYWASKELLDYSWITGDDVKALQAFVEGRKDLAELRKIKN
jgi:hypothetical protein